MDNEKRKNLATQASSQVRTKVAVIVPPVSDFYFTPHRFSSLGAQVICNILKNNGIPYEFFNFPLMKKKPQLIDIPKDINYLSNYIIPGETGRLSYFTHYQRFGPSTEECARVVVDSRPTICLLSCFAFSYSSETIDLARHIKNICPELPVVAGGAGVSAYPLYFVKDTPIDFAISGEAEISLVKFLHLFFLTDVTFVEIPNLHLNLNSPFNKQRKNQKAALSKYTGTDEIAPVCKKVHETKSSVFYAVSVSRGCDKTCRFCSNYLAHGKGFRIAAMDRIESMINEVPIDEKPRIFINFEDDNLLFAKNELLRMMRLFLKKQKKIQFLCENGIDYNLLTPDLADTLIQAGICKFNFTLGSKENNVLLHQDRNGSITHFEAIVRHIASKNAPVLSYFICGLKGDSRESVANTLCFLYSLPTQIGISMFYAVPGLPDFSNLSQFDGFSPCRCNSSSAFPWYGEKGISTLMLVTAFRLSRYINLLKSDIKSEIECRLIEKIQKEKKLFTLAKAKNAVEIIDVPNVDEKLSRMVLEKITP
jgi:radical SAM superfamily enzyme YgiQ (UPF0313 family)